MYTEIAIATGFLGLASAYTIIPMPATLNAVYLCGDSTMARAGGGGGTEGWGTFLQYSFDPHKAFIINRAIGGRSSRSYTREGHFDAVAEVVKTGDWVVMEFGHNDAGSLARNDNGRTACPGAGGETCKTKFKNVDETVLTYPAYLKNAAKKFKEKGAQVIVASPTPRNVWGSGTYAWGPDRFANFSRLVVEELGGPEKGYWFVPHGAYAAQAMKHLNKTVVDKNYPHDHVHPAPFLSDAIHKAFVLAMRCGSIPLASLAMNTTEEMTSTFLGGCIGGWDRSGSSMMR